MHGRSISVAAAAKATPKTNYKITQVDPVVPTLQLLVNKKERPEFHLWEKNANADGSVSKTSSKLAIALLKKTIGQKPEKPEERKEELKPEPKEKTVMAERIANEMMKRTKNEVLKQTFGTKPKT